MAKGTAFQELLESMATSVASKLNQSTAGEPEDQLRGPFETFIVEVGELMGWKVVPTGETPLEHRLGRPDYAIHRDGLLVGYVECKAPDSGADPRRFTGRNREQWKRFQNLPNVLYTDGREWTLFQDGKPVDEAVRLSTSFAAKGRKQVDPAETGAVEKLLRAFLLWKPIIPRDRKGQVDLKGLAGLLAPLCRLLRDEVTEALGDPNSPLVGLAASWRELLFPYAPDEQFADAYAQTVTFALLLGRSEGADEPLLEQAVSKLGEEHGLLSKALQVLTDRRARQEIQAALDMLERVIAEVPANSLHGGDDPWLYFYEDFLAAYDPELRKNAGAYYTPVQVVEAQVRLIDDLLSNHLGKPQGFSSSDVVTLDPAAGTGTYLLGVIRHALKRVEVEQGPGAVAARATTLAANLYGFEMMVGPYAVTELRTTRALRDRGAHFPKEGSQVFLTDTLENPHAQPPQIALWNDLIAEQHYRALRVKSKVPVLVCLGNPPYDRHEAATAENRARTGGWVRWGDTGDEAGSIMADFVAPVRKAGHGVHVKNLYNLYVYFWRWALWKVFEHDTSSGPGVVSFISASSYLDGAAFAGMRQHMRQICDEIWILDLGGEGRGTRKTENVFAIQTPVAIAIAVRTGKARKRTPAQVRYARMDGTREEKLAALAAIETLESLEWQECATGWAEPFRPEGKGRYFSWPELEILFPWRHTGCEPKRMWPISHSQDTLEERWNAFLNHRDRASALKVTRDRGVDSEVRDLIQPEVRLRPLVQLDRKTPVLAPARYALRSFDRQWVIPDNRVGDYFRPDLWKTLGKKQVFLAGSLVLELGGGPAITATCVIPDRHYFAGRGGKDILPLYRNSAGTEPNLTPGLLDMLSKQYARRVTPEDFVAYVYGILAQPQFTSRFSKELESRELRVPITRDGALFSKVSVAGARLLWLHTYGERFVPKGKKRGEVPRGSARSTVGIPGTPDGYPESFEYNDATRTLHVGEGQFAPVSREVFEFEVSGLKVVQSWLKYRMKKGAGKKSSPLDDIRPERWTSAFTTELLELLWVLEATIEGYPEQARLLKEVATGPCFQARDLPPVPEAMRKPPRAPGEQTEIFEE